MKPISISNREFARRDGCSETLVRKALRSGHLLAGADGKLDPRLVGTGWRRANREPTDIATDPSSLAEAQRRKAVALADLREMEVDLERARYAPINEMAAMIIAEYALVRERLGRIPAEVAASAAEARTAAEVQQLLAAAINTALRELSI